MSSEQQLWDELSNKLEKEGVIKITPQKEKKEFNGDKCTLEKAKSALYFLSPDCTNQEWVEFGFALKSEFGDAAYDTFNEWSSNGSTYNKYEMRTRWKSFSNRDGITIATLFHKAMEAGWIPEPIVQEPIPDFIINGRMTGHYYPPEEKKTKPRKETVKVIPQAEEKPKIDTATFPADLLKAPGLPGIIADFINRTSLMPQPVLALAAGLATAGSLMGRKVRGDTNIRTNMYIIGLAPSGSGKDHARSIIKRLFQEVGLSRMELGVPASSAGLISSLHNSGESRGIVLWDEFGRKLKQILGHKAGTYEQDIVTAMVELFSSSQSIYVGKAYADHDSKRPTKSLDQPCLSVYATSVPSHFYDALSGSDAVDGFLSRWLLFESKDYSLEEEEREDAFSEIPQAMIDVCKYWKEQPFNSEANGNIADVTRIVPRLVKCNEAAAAHLKGFAMETRRMARLSEMNQDPTGAIWSRAGEHARRLALVACEGDFINLKVAEWAVKASRSCCEYMGYAVGDYISSSELEAQTKRVLRYLKEKGDRWATRAEITRSFQGIQARVRNEIIASLLERNEIEIEKMTSAGRPLFKYRALV